MITSLATKHILGISQWKTQFTHKMAAKARWHRNYATVILCIFFTQLWRKSRDCVASSSLAASQSGVPEANSGIALDITLLC